MIRRKHHRVSYFASSFAVVLGIILIWRGIWYLLEWIDMQIFGGTHIISIIGGIILGFAILYLPDKDLSELRKL
jgi:hypothetical protein